MTEQEFAHWLEDQESGLDQLLASMVSDDKEAVVELDENGQEYEPF